MGTGTGAVHTAPGYGKEDYLCGMKNGLEIVVTVDGKGYQTEGARPFKGLFYEKSNAEIIKMARRKITRGMLAEKLENDQLTLSLKT